MSLIIYIDRQRCRVCHQPLPSNRWAYCCEACRIEAGRFKNRPQAVKERHRQRVARWMAEHPEPARDINRRKDRKYRAKKSVERYQTTDYVIRAKCLIPLGTVVRVLSYTDRGRLKVEWADQVVEVPLCCVRKISAISIDKYSFGVE